MLLHRVHIKEQTRAEIAKQVKEQVDSQIVEYIPVPLRQQAAEGKKQLDKVRASLHNSYVAAQPINTKAE